MSRAGLVNAAYGEDKPMTFREARCTMVSKEMIENELREAINCVSGMEGIDKDTNLISNEVAIAPVDFLYIFDIIEKKLNLKVFEILQSHSYHIMTIRKLTDTIYSHNAHILV